MKCQLLVNVNNMCPACKQYAPSMRSLLHFCIAIT